MPRVNSRKYFTQQKKAVGTWSVNFLQVSTEPLHGDPELDRVKCLQGGFSAVGGWAAGGWAGRVACCDGVWP